MKAVERKYQVWQGNAPQVPLFFEQTFMQMLDYIHHPVKAGLCRLPEEYAYSSARFYIENRMDFDFLSHYDE